MNRNPVHEIEFSGTSCVWYRSVVVTRTFPAVCQLANHVRYTVRPNHEPNEVSRQHCEDVEHPPNRAYGPVPPLRAELNDGESQTVCS